MNKKAFLSSMVLGVATLAISASPSVAKDSKMEKCYGIVKAGKNDCAGLKGVHSCAGAASVDGSKSDWIYLPQGTCERIVGGVLNPK